MDSKTTKKGFLTKQGHFIKNWKRRFFVLRGATLSYYEDEPHDGKEHGHTLRGTVPIAGCEIDPDDEDFDEPFVFIIHKTKSNKDFPISCETAPERADWIRTLRFVSAGLPVPQTTSLLMLPNVSFPSSRRTNTLSHLERLPDESFRYLLRYCGTKDIISIGSVSRTARSAVHRTAEHLDLSQSKLDPVRVMYLASQFPTLQHLILRGLPIEDEFVAAATKTLPNLTAVDISNCRRIADHAVDSLTRRCTALQVLDLYACVRITDRSLEYLAQHSHLLRRLDLRGSGAGNVAGLQTLCSGCPQLQSLSVGGMFATEHVNDDVIASLAEHCADLRALQLPGHPRVSNKGLALLAAGCTKLEKLLLRGWDGITDEGVQALGNLTLLRKLRLTGCEMITEVSLGVVLRNCIELKLLDVSGCKRTGDRLMRYIAASAINLTTLYITGCAQMSNAGLAEAKAARPLLRKLDTRDCPLIEPVQALPEKRRQ
eukprot:TRINITY_DN10227_c0_g1_i2.p1 TRINITY_DN10227_c0_g1~~TRINITY_DN10227_c0_g1_i2.p1  ORF type:complete len:485 (-),score=72.04 TRINITY_DN10227_c0_g1_i2:178-1632(-)